MTCLRRLGAALHLVGPGRGRDEHHLVQPLLELREVERPIVHRGGQAEAEVHQRLLPGHVPEVHPSDLRHRHVRLVDEEEEVVGEVVQQRPRRAAWRAGAEVPRVVLDARAVAHLLQHLQIVPAAGLQPGRLQHLALLSQPGQPLRQLLLDRFARLVHLLCRCHPVLRRVELELISLRQHLSGQRVHLHDALDLVAPEGDAHAQLLVGGKDVQRIAANAEGAATEVQVVALVLHVHQRADEAVEAAALPLFDRRYEAQIVLRVAQAVDA